MFVIKGQFGVADLPAGFVQDTDYVLPAENCVWQVQQDAYGYSLTLAEYVLGGTLYAIVNPELGVVGKSGRFTAVTN